MMRTSREINGQFEFFSVAEKIFMELSLFMEQFRRNNFCVCLIGKFIR